MPQRMENGPSGRVGGPASVRIKCFVLAVAAGAWVWGWGRGLRE